MTRLGLKTYIAQQLTLLDIPVSLTVLIQRPKEVEIGEHAVVLVEITEAKEKRLTLGRPGGAKRIDHRIVIGVYWMATNAEAGADFDQVLDQIDAIFRVTTIPVTVADPQSGVQSQVVWIGETIETRVNEPMLDDSIEGLVIFSADKWFEVWEQVTG